MLQWVAMRESLRRCHITAENRKVKMKQEFVNHIPKAEHEATETVPLHSTHFQFEKLSETS